MSRGFTSVEEFLDDRADTRRPPVSETRIQKTPAKRTISGPAMAKARLQAARMMTTGQWDGATGKHFVALYEIAHEQVYGVAPIETGESRHFWSMIASKLLRDRFDGDEGWMATFIRWSWYREAKAVESRRVSGREGRRIGIKLQFSTSLLTDYLVAQRAGEPETGPRK